MRTRVHVQTHPHTLTLSLSHQGPVLHILSEQAVVIQGVFGFAGHTVYWSFVHLMLNSTEKHVQRLPHCVLGKQQAVRAPREGDKHREGTGHKRLKVTQDVLGRGMRRKKLCGSKSRPSPEGSLICLCLAHPHKSVQADGHPIGEQLLHYGLCPGMTRRRGGQSQQVGGVQGCVFGRPQTWRA